MEYTATVNIETSHDVDSILETLAPYSGAVADSKSGYRAAFNITAPTLDDGYRAAMSVATSIGTPNAIEITPSDLLDAEIETIPHLVSISEAAEMLDISAQAVHKRIKVGSLPGCKVGNTWVIPLHAVLASM